MQTVVKLVNSDLLPNLSITLSPHSFINMQYAFPICTGQSEGRALRHINWTLFKWAPANYIWTLFHQKVAKIKYKHKHTRTHTNLTSQQKHTV